MENKKSKYRKIIHIDMDAFFASIEQRDHPHLRHRPVAVGGAGSRGVVAAASYEARKFGVYSAMASRIAKHKCPQLIFVKPRFDVYKAASSVIMTIFRDYTDLVEPLSLDEAYLDVTENKKGIHSATIIAREIKTSIKEKTRLTASAGISINKFLAKVASGMNKPNGLTVITPGEVHEFIKTLPIEKFFGIGKVTAAKMKALEIYNGSDLLEFDQLELIRHFGKMGNYFYKVVRGEDTWKVKPERIRKSLGAECTFDNDIVSMQTLHEELKSICEELGRRLVRSNVSGKTVTLKIKYFDFDLKTRSVSLNKFQINAEEIFKIAKKLLHSDNLPRKAIRLLGVSLSNLNDGSEKDISNQLTLEF